MYYPLPGEIQTVPRAELSTLVTPAEIVEEGAIIVYFWVNKQVVDLFNKGEQPCSKPSNSGLYNLLFSYRSRKNLDLTVHWMLAHLDNPQSKTKSGKPKQRPVYVHDHDVIDNKEADLLADRAAEIAELPSWQVDPLIDAVHMARSIKLRIATIVCATYLKDSTQKTNVMDSLHWMFYQKTRPWPEQSTLCTPPTWWCGALCAGLMYIIIHLNLFNSSAHHVPQ